MKPIDTFKFCPKCGAILRVKKENLLLCQNCGFEFYINSIPCNAAIIENEKEEILLVKRKYEPQKGKWDWPGGFLNGGEDFKHSVIREIKEELGVDIKTGEIIGTYSGSYEFQNIEFPILCLVVPAKIIKGEINVSDDVSGYKYFSPEEILKMDLSFELIKQGIRDYLKQKT